MSSRGEFQRIDAFVRAFRPAPSPEGPGDDCAVISPRKGQALCATTDAVVEDRHFTRRAFTPADIGHKALAVNLSDLAAMGARPRWILCSLELPPWVDDRALAGLAKGMSALARRFGVALAGGNLSGARQLSVCITALGEVPAGKALLRSGARPGHLLYVSGKLGEARWELHRMLKGRPAGPHQRRPVPKVALGLLARRFASAAVDLSDGLAQDLGHLLQASGAGARVALARLPVSARLRRAVGAEAQRWALAGGEDYELLLSVPPAKARAFEQACRRTGERVSLIGEVTRRRGLYVRDEEGQLVTPPAGFDHFQPGGQRIDPPAQRK